jgi:hypothetical protein
VSRRKLWLDRSTFSQLFAAAPGTRLIAAGMTNDAGAVEFVFENEAWGRDVGGADAPVLSYGIVSYGDGPTRIEVRWPISQEDQERS